MPSANGYKLQVGQWELVASWAAPFFALILGEADEEPMLIHCESLAHAQGKRGIVLDASFNEISA
jgi:hypothetical protein